MFKCGRSQLGVTLVEMMLVLVIGASMLYLGMRTFITYRRDADFQQVRYQVDVLFQAMYRYFQANCANTQMGRSYANQYLAIPMSELTTGGYLTETFTPIPSVIKYGKSGEGYVLQFNQLQTSGALPPRTINLSPTGSSSMGGVVIWQAQVAFNLNPNFPASQLQASVGADCLSSPSSGVSGFTIQPCSDTSTGTYAVFQRLPSAGSTGITSNYWSNRPYLQMFKQMYSTTQINLLIEPRSSTWRDRQYFICNG